MSNAKEAKANIRSMERSDIHEVLTLYRTIGGSEGDVIDFDGKFQGLYLPDSNSLHKPPCEPAL